MPISIHTSMMLTVSSVTSRVYNYGGLICRNCGYFICRAGHMSACFYLDISQVTTALFKKGLNFDTKWAELLNMNILFYFLEMLFKRMQHMRPRWGDNRKKTNLVEPVVLKHLFSVHFRLFLLYKSSIYFYKYTRVIGVFFSM